MDRSRPVVVENPPPPFRRFSRILPERGRLETVVDDGSLEATYQPRYRFDWLRLSEGLEEVTEVT